MSNNQYTAPIKPAVVTPSKPAVVTGHQPRQPDPATKPLLNKPAAK